MSWVRNGFSLSTASIDVTGLFKQAMGVFQVGLRLCCAAAKIGSIGPKYARWTVGFTERLMMAAVESVLASQTHERNRARPAMQLSGKWHNVQIAISLTHSYHETDCRGSQPKLLNPLPEGSRLPTRTCQSIAG